ncbi:MAG: Coenzyme F420 hydrogenase/dehydrogenase, beta subunit C-terminal domain [Sterolibacterium sp.]|nr:Coenzyme F420 hydrogenase/dehydrogenase, beta subunit C-terminal domain [Sterolibacterium sp.]
MNSPYHSSFKDMMNDVVAAGSCCECGSCVVVCPHNVIEYIDGKPKQTAKASAAFDSCGVSEGIGCDVCAAVCPRLWPREPHLRDSVFGDERNYEGIFGVYRHIFVARTRQQDVLARAQDGGIVTALLAWARETGRIDGAVVAAVGDGDQPCFPTPKLATTVEQIKASASSWYTYCANNLALKQVVQQDLKQVAFVGVPCQITPLRKMESIDPSLLLAAKKRPQTVAKQRGFLRGHAERVAFSVGLFCTEVFRPELMTERIEQGMGIPLTEVSKFNVKGEVLIYRKDGDIARIPLEEAMREYQRPECRHCGDFSAEMADIACGGIGTDRATIVVLRTQKALDLWRAFEASGQVEVWPIQENKISWNILQRLARRQRERIPLGAPCSGTAPDLPQYSPRREAELAAAAITATGRPATEIEACLEAAYANAARPLGVVGYLAGEPIPGDPGDPAEGQKRKLPPPPAPAQGGAPPGWQPLVAIDPDSTAP